MFEYYYVPFPEKELLQNGINSFQLQQVLSNTKEYLEYDSKVDPGDGLFAHLINEYQQKIGESTKYTTQQKAALISGVTYKMTLVDNDGDNLKDGIKFQFDFKNSTCYAEFKGINDYTAEDKVVETIDTIFTTTTKIVKDPIFDKITSNSITIGMACLDLVDKQMEDVFGFAGWEDLKYRLDYNKYSSQFDYTLIVPTSRIHTNAPSIEKDSSGTYYHTWTVNLNNVDENGNSKIQIEYWTTKANKWVWYVFSGVVAAAIITTTFIIGNKNEKQKEKLDQTTFNPNE